MVTQEKVESMTQNEANFVFYDTETTGTETAFDQILQFGAIRTDRERGGGG